MALKLVIDSSADLTHADVDENVEILPIPVFIDGKEYLPFINLTNEDFYRLQKEAKELPKTVQVPFNLLYKTFKEELLKGNEVVAIFIASKLSGTYSSACAVREQLVDELGEEVREKLFIIDSLTVTYPLGALCLEAYKMLKNGSSAKEVFERINYLVPRLKMRAFIKDLTYLKKGGRISGASAAVAGILSIKPVIKVEDGVLTTTNKERGLNNAMKRVCETAINSNIDYSLPCYLGYTSDKETGDILLSFVEKLTNIKIEKVISIGPTVGAHAGPGCTGICWFEK